MSWSNGESELSTKLDDKASEKKLKSKKQNKRQQKLLCISWQLCFGAFKGTKFGHGVRVSLVQLK